MDIIETGTPLKLLVIQGEIYSGDGQRFIELAGSLRHASVLLASPGGSLRDGLEIGRAIHSSGFFTGVAPNTACASACALAWLGGRTRYMDPSALVGFHAAYTQTNGIAEQSGVGNALVGAYLNELGLSAEAIVFATSAAPDQMNWLNAAQAQQAGIDLVFLTSDGQESLQKEERPLKLPSGFRWIVLESGQSVVDLRYDSFADQVVRTQNGNYAAVLGPFEKAVAERMVVEISGIPEDAYLSSGNGFLFEVR